MLQGTPAKDRAVAMARKVLDGEVGVIEGARALVGLMHLDSEIASGEDFNSLCGIDSETDDLPIGRVREEWHQDSLVEKDREIARCEDFYGDRVRSACERIIARACRTE